MKSLLLPLVVCFGLLALHSAPAQQFVFTPSFPSGVDWSNATPDQISKAVYEAVQDNPEQAVEIVTAALNAAKNTQRFPSIATSDGKQFVDPENTDPTGTIEDVAQRIGNAAKQANPAMAPQIDAAITSMVPTVSMIGGSSGSGGSGGGSGGLKAAAQFRTLPAFPPAGRSWWPRWRHSDALVCPAGRPPALLPGPPACRRICRRGCAAGSRCAPGPG